MDKQNLPDGVYINVDKKALAEETDRAMVVILDELIGSVSNQTHLIAEIDRGYVAARVPLFIRKQSAQRLGDLLQEVTINPTMLKVKEVMKKI